MQKIKNEVQKTYPGPPMSVLYQDLSLRKLASAASAEQHCS